MKKIFISTLFLITVFTIESQTVKFGILNENDYFSFEHEVHDSYKSTKIYVNKDGSNYEIYEYKDVLLDIQLSENRRSLYCLVKLAGSTLKGVIWKFDGDLGKSFLIGRTMRGFKISKDEKYLIGLEFTKEFEVYDMCIYSLNSFTKEKYFNSQEIILTKYPNSKYPAYYIIELFNNSERNGINVIFDQYGEAGPESFSIFISFDDFKYSFLDSDDLKAVEPIIQIPGE